MEKIRKRSDYIQWDEYFMGIAMLSAQRSKDPNSQVGCCIVGKNNRIISMGYNGFPNGISDDDFPWAREGDPLDTKYMYVCHSELNAILNTNQDLTGSTIYVTLFPCNECAKAIIQKGIARVVYLENKYPTEAITIASTRMLNAAGVKVSKYEPIGREIKLKL